MAAKTRIQSLRSYPRLIHLEPRNFHKKNFQFPSIILPRGNNNNNNNDEKRLLIARRERRGWRRAKKGMGESRTVGCTGGAAIFVARRNRGVITGGIRGNGDNAWLERWGP